MAYNVFGDGGLQEAIRQVFAKLKTLLDGKVSTSDYAPVAKTSDMTQAVGKDANGQLWTEPGVEINLGISGASVGQVATVSAVDGTGKPTAWGAENAISDDIRDALLACFAHVEWKDATGQKMINNLRNALGGKKMIKNYIDGITLAPGYIKDNDTIGTQGAETKEVYTPNFLPEDAVVDDILIFAVTDKAHSTSSTLWVGVCQYDAQGSILSRTVFSGQGTGNGGQFVAVTDNDRAICFLTTMCNANFTGSKFKLTFRTWGNTEILLIRASELLGVIE